MTYALIDLAFLAAAGVLTALLTWPAAPHVPAARRRPRSWVPALAAGEAIVTLTAVFDNVMIAAGLFGYAPEALAGPALGLAPVEDFAYPVAAAVLLPVLWRRLTRPGAGRRAADASAVPSQERR